jgi:Tol biopolymer transport system component
MEMFVKEAGSSSNGKIFQTGLDGSNTISDVSPDGKSILYQFENEASNETSIYGQPLAGGKPFLIARTVKDALPRLSADGRWVAFESNESGASNIFVRSFTPEAATSTQVSFDGGHEPRWSRDGKELFYRRSDGNIVGVRIVDLKQPRFGKPATLFRLPENAEYDTVDGKRFLVHEPAGPSSAPLFVIANWKPEPARSE